MGNSPSSPLPNVQSVAVKNNQKEGFSAIYRSLLVGEGPLVTRYNEEVGTLYDSFRAAATKFPQNKCLGARRFQSEGGNGEYYWQNYEAVWKRINNFASGLAQVGCEKGNHIGIFSRNRPEWVIAEQACYAQNMVVVALYDTLGPDSVAYILNHASIRTVICTQDKIKKILDVADKCPDLKTLVQIEYEGNKDLIALAESKGVKLYSFAELEDRGALRPVAPQPPSPDDLSTIMYTSGTTGVPKGVLLTHKNVLSAVSSGYKLISGIVTPDDIEISFLPMAHIFERVVQGIVIAFGASIGFFQGDVQKLFDDIAVLKPTILPGVPRLFSRVFDKVMQSKDQKGGIAKFLFDLGFSSKQSILESGQSANDSIWNSIVFDKIRERFGGRIRIVITGAAPITKEVFQFLQICFSCPILQGYGLTETCAACSICDPRNVTPGHTGPPVLCVEIRLADVPDMKYFSTDKPCPRGEVCIRGPAVFSGYYKSPDQTKECIDEEGWFHTGDVGVINADGTLSIIDRKKNIFKLAQGEYVAAEYLEGVYQKNKFVMQIFIYGDSTQVCLVGVVVPDPDVLIPWAKENGINSTNMEELCKNEQVKKAIFQDMNATAKESKLLGFEFVKAIHLEHTAFSVENELLTPTFKLKRPQLKDYYKQTIANLYASIPPSQ